MIRGPDASDTLVDTCDGLLGTLQFLAASLLEQVCFLEDLFGLEVANTDRLLTSVDVVALDYRVLVWSWRYADFNLRVGFGEGGKSVLQESSG